MYIRMNKKACFNGTREDENGTTGVTLKTGKYYRVGDQITAERADQLVAASAAIFTDSGDPKSAKEVDSDKKVRLQAAYDQQMAEEAAMLETRQLKKQNLQPAQTAAFTAKGVRA